MDKRYEELYNKLTPADRWTVATLVMWEAGPRGLEGDVLEFYNYLNELPEQEQADICNNLEREGLDDAKNYEEDGYWEELEKAAAETAAKAKAAKEAENNK